jgi:hypothetical protein
VHQCVSLKALGRLAAADVLVSGGECPHWVPQQAKQQPMAEALENAGPRGVVRQSSNPRCYFAASSGCEM